MINSYLLYLFTIFSASGFASLAQRYSKINKKGIRKPHKIFWLISMAILIFIMGFREYFVGVDGANYIRMYNEINSTTLVKYYSLRTTEPGYYILNKLIYLIFNDYQWVFICSAFITIACFYKAISYEIENISLNLAIFIFTTTQYFYYFGIMRMGIATAIVSVAFRYILKNNRKAYIFMVLLATSFHYSALFALSGLFIKRNPETERFKNTTLLKIIILIPIAFFAVRYLIFPFITASRYQRYINSTSITSLGFITSLPTLLLFTIFYKKMTKMNKNYQFYFILFLTKVITEIFAPIIGIGRMVWYVNLSLCFLFPIIIRINKDRMTKLLIFTLTILYCFTYSYGAYFGDSPRGKVMLPYENIYFKK